MQKLYWLTMSLPIAGLLEMLWVMYFVWRKFGFIGFRIPKVDGEIRVLMSKMLPGIGAAGISQLNIFLSTVMASFTTGGISYLYYADRIYQLPLAIIGTALGSVMLSELSSAFAASDRTRFLGLQGRAIEIVLLTTVPITTFIALESHDIVSMLFERGAFDAQAVSQTAKALKIFAFGIPLYSLHKVLSATFFAIGNTRYPMQMAAISLGLNVVVSISLLGLLGHCAVAVGSVAAFGFGTVALGMRLAGLKQLTHCSELMFASKCLLLSVLMGVMLLVMQSYGLEFLVRIAVYGLLIGFIILAYARRR